MKDPFSHLGLQRNATVDAIKKAYRALAKTCHPDLRSDKEAAAIEFRELTRIYEIALSMAGSSAPDKTVRPSKPIYPVVIEVNIGIIDDFELSTFGEINRTVICPMALLQYGGIVHVRFTRKQTFILFAKREISESWTFTVLPKTKNNQRFRLDVSFGRLILALVGQSK